MGSQPNVLQPQEVNLSQSQSPPDFVAKEEIKTEVEQVLSQKMGELSSQERAELEIEAGFPGDFISANNNEDPKENGHGNDAENNVKKSTKRGADGDLAASPTKKVHQDIETANEEVASTDFIKPLAASTQNPHADVVKNDSQKSVLSQEILAQIPGFVDCAEEELQSVDSAEIVEKMISNVKGSVHEASIRSL
ncbi:unnamed protein product [Oikopleura dioica]|uniref:Uncharacterized protein n=1 Tax=Oikopleura dioica TaxID=34765 RepID=E4YRG7_OIKDI|nr:unnamed protein product [Oikopleura dioica]